MAKKVDKPVYSLPLSEYSVMIFRLKKFSTRVLKRGKAKLTSNLRLSG